MFQRCSYKKLVNLCIASLLTGICNSASAAGFAIKEQSARLLGTSFAGSASLAEDASTAFYNPAGLVRLRCEQIVFVATGVLVRSKLTVFSQTPTFPRVGLVTVPSDTSSSVPRSQAIIPAIHYARRLDDRFVFGLSVASHFGLVNTWANTSSARYMATRSSLKVYDISPNFAYCLGYGFSVGVGLDLIYSLANLDLKINSFGPGSGNPTTDGYQLNNAEGWGVGFHAGLLWQLGDATRIGAQYRSQAKERLRGDSTLFIPGVTPAEQIQRVRANVTLPDIITGSAYQSFCDDMFALMADVEWTRWTRFKQLVLRYQDGSSVTTNEFFKNTIRVAVGASFKPDECWKLRLGWAWDPTPTQDRYRTVRLPDQTRNWASVGVQYNLTDCLALDVGYAHLFIRKSNVNDVAPTILPASRGQTRQSLRGRVRSGADLLGIQLTWDIV